MTLKCAYTLLSNNRIMCIGTKLKESIINFFEMLPNSMQLALSHITTTTYTFALFMLDEVFP